MESLVTSPANGALPKTLPRATSTIRTGRLSSSRSCRPSFARLRFATCIWRPRVGRWSLARRRSIRSMLRAVVGSMPGTWRSAIGC